MNKITLFILVLLVFSCAEKLMEKPENLIAKDKMIMILEDMAVLQSAKATNISILQNYEVEPMPYIFSKYGVDSIQFVESDRYYASLPEEYESIYTTIETRLAKEHDKLTEIKRVKDSLKQEQRKALQIEKNLNDSLR